MDDKAYILAMYDIRGKQEFIYKSSKIKEIMGGSYLIRDCFKDCLFPAAKKCPGKGIFHYKQEPASERESRFSEENFRRRLEAGYIGEVVYDGGGNFFVLYRDAAVYRAVNRIFYRKLLDYAYSLRVLTTYIDQIDFSDYPGDQRRLYAEHRKREQRESMIFPVNTLPVVQTDYRTSLPLAAMQFTGEKMEKVSLESQCKYRKYEEVAKTGSDDSQIQGTRKQDLLITEKGEASLLAVVYIDGNNMGAQVEKCLKGKRTYEECAEALRTFSAEIQEHYITRRIESVDRILQTRDRTDRRFIVYAGDEVTFICNAGNAYDVALEYLRSLAADSPADAPRTSCAGIAVFHSHAPFAEAYRIAEECCESGKQLMKEEGMEHASLIDFHYCQGAFGTSLEEIRRREETEDSSRPWFVDLEAEVAGREKPDLVCGKYISDRIVRLMEEELRKAGRSNIKNLAFCAKKSGADFRSELERIRAHQVDKKIDFTLGGLLPDAEMQRKLIYDMAIVYDLWFRQQSRKTEQEAQETGEEA